jgi:hypothetical protein
VLKLLYQRTYYALAKGGVYLTSGTLKTVGQETRQLLCGNCWRVNEAVAVPQNEEIVIQFKTALLPRWLEVFK